MMFARRLIVLLLLLAGGCSKPPAGSSLFPLEAGHEWTYDVKTEWDGGRIEHESLTLSALGEEKLEGSTAWHRRSNLGVDYWLRVDDTGIYRVASKSEIEEEAKPDNPRRYVLKTPIMAGTGWQASTTAYLLQRPTEFPREISHTYPSIPMVYTIEAVAEKVSTEAGNFEGCVRVKGTAAVRLYVDGVTGWRDVPLTTIEWYCPGAGLVRLERNETAGSTSILGSSLLGGIVTMDLVSWR
jgi:hypothetical protein